MLHYHWLKCLEQNQIAVVRQGPVRTEDSGAADENMMWEINMNSQYVILDEDGQEDHPAKLQIHECWKGLWKNV